MTFQNRTTLPGSENVHRPGLEPSGSIERNETVQVSVILRRKSDNPDVISGNASQTSLSHEEHEQKHGANPADIALVEQFAHESGLTVVEESALKRRVILTGSAEQMQSAFGADLVCYKAKSTGQTYRGRQGTLNIPTALKGIVLSVLGLDTRPVAKPHFRTSAQAAVTTGTFTPPQVAALYNFPTGVTGKGQTIGIIELGGGYKSADLNTYFKRLGLKTPNVAAVSVDGGKNTSGSDADGEVLLDIEIAGAIANDASVAVYFAPNTDQGFIDAVINAVHDTKRKPSVISISWGGPEDTWSVQSRNAMNSALQDAAALGVTVTAASGDDGSTDGAGDGKLHVDFPAASPYVLACGGTTLKGAGKTISSEAVWNEATKKEGASGGGVSNFFALPNYQSSAGVPKQPQTSFAGRGVPDVAGDADPVTGYQVRVDSQNTVVGGTSAVAPLWAALIALMNQQIGKPVGFLNPKLYSNARSTFHDITTGNNDDSNLGYYKAQKGWDACTGLGSPNGTALLQALSSSASTTGQRMPLPGSDPQHSPSAQWTDVANPEKQVTVTIILRRSGEDPGDALLAGAEPALIHGEAAASTTASPEDVHQVESFAREHGLIVAEANPTARTVKLKGTTQQLSDAFGVTLGLVGESEGEKFLSHKEAISIPQSLAKLITAVLGLDQRPIAKHHI